MRYLFIFLIFVLTFFFTTLAFGQGQVVEKDRVVYTPIASTLIPKLVTNRQFTALLIRSSNFIDFNQYALLLNKDTIRFQRDIHSPNDYYQSNLIHFDPSILNIQWLSTGLETGVELILIDGSLNQKSQQEIDRRSGNIYNNCAAPALISQEVWRDGLAAPNYNRSFSTVYNIIVHHSAGSNTSTNYLQTVRDIYLYHTQVNGWSDIGYNYLVDPAGTIYAGRDPGNGYQDKVLGAHFCGSNSGTMGVCLLGNYEQVQPSDQLLAGMEQVLSWKINKEDQLTANGVYSHPLNSNLSQIAGHRDGCSTLCPGEYVYNRLSVIRSTVDSTIQECSSGDSTNGDPTDPEEPDSDHIVIDLEPIEEEISLDDYTIYPNPVAGSKTLFISLSKDKQATLKGITIFNTAGQVVSSADLVVYENRIKISLDSNLKPGIYIISFYQPRALISKRFLLL